MFRIRQHLGGHSLLHRFPFREDDHAIGEIAREVVVVRGDDERPSARRELTQSLA